jgi:tellurite resistance protein
MLYFIIIWGSRGINSTLKTGKFFCPECDVSDCHYKHIRVRNFFTLYFIPLIPMGTLGEYIECQHCKLTYKKSILRYDPEAAHEKALAEFEIAITKIMVMMMLADGIIDDSEIEAIQEIYGQLAKRELSRQEIDQYITDLEQKRAGEPKVRKRLLRKMIGSLNSEGCEMVFKAAFMVAASDNDIPPEEQELLEEIGLAMGIKKKEIRAMVDDFEPDPNAQQRAAIPHQSASPKEEAKARKLDKKNELRGKAPKKRRSR